MLVLKDLNTQVICPHCNSELDVDLLLTTEHSGAIMEGMSIISDNVLGVHCTHCDEDFKITYEIACTLKSLDTYVEDRNIG